MSIWVAEQVKVASDPKKQIWDPAAVAEMEKLLGGATYSAGNQSVYVDYVKVTPDNAKDFVK